MLAQCLTWYHENDTEYRNRWFILGLIGGAMLADDERRAEAEKLIREAAAPIGRFKNTPPGADTKELE